MDYFNYIDGQLCAENALIADIAETHGTPCYIYSRATLERHFIAYQKALKPSNHLICYAVKANSNIAVLNLFARLGAGFDIVSVGELERVLLAKGDPQKIVFSGVGKTEYEMQRALEVGIYCFNVESIEELQRLSQVATKLGKTAAVSLRINPNVDAETHPYISTGLRENKFGISSEQAVEAYQLAVSLSNINVVGMDCHIGSQLTSLEPYLDAIDCLLTLIDTLAKHQINLKHLDLGGGLGVCYHDEKPPEPGEFAQAVQEKLSDRKLKIIVEPGRSIMANAGILVTKVEYLKCTDYTNFAIVDAGMNDLIRPALYSAWQAIVPVKPHTDSSIPTRHYDIVGPVCETADFLGKGRELALCSGDLLAVRSAGAYGFCMASNYNARNRPAEIMVDGDQYHLVRERETIAAQMQGEHLLPDNG